MSEATLTLPFFNPSGGYPPSPSFTDSNYNNNNKIYSYTPTEQKVFWDKNLGSNGNPGPSKTITPSEFSFPTPSTSSPIEEAPRRSPTVYYPSHFLNNAAAGIQGQQQNHAGPSTHSPIEQVSPQQAFTGGASSDNIQDVSTESVVGENGEAGGEAEDDAEPLYVNAKQYHRILKRRATRTRLEELNRLAKSRKPYLHESRHRHACNRPRGKGGRFLTAEEIEALKKDKAEGGDQSNETPSSTAEGGDEQAY